MKTTIITFIILMGLSARAENIEFKECMEIETVETCAEFFYGDEKSGGMPQLIAGFLAGYAVSKGIDHAWNAFKTKYGQAVDAYRREFTSQHDRMRRDRAERGRENLRERTRRERERFNNYRRRVEENASAGFFI